MDEAFKQILDTLPARKTRSRLEPYGELIREMRLRLYTFGEIAAFLGDRYGVTVTASGVHDFVRRRTRWNGARTFAAETGAVRSNTKPSVDSSVDPTGFTYDPAEPLRLDNKRGKS